MNCVELLCDFLRQADVKTIFGVPGYANGPVTLATHKFPDIQPVLTKHEGGAAWMAYGYALTSGKFGVCTGTSGPGTTNLLSGVVAAYANSMPVLVITGQVETHKYGRRAFQELTGVGPRSVGATELLQKMTKFSITVKTARSFPEILQLAYVTMMSGRRGPVHLNIPIDVQKAETGVNVFTFPQNWDRRPTPQPRDMQTLYGLLEEAKAPLMIIGRGCLPQRQLTQQMLAKSTLPFGTTIQAKGMSGVKSRYNLGTIGVAGAPRCNAYAKEAADLIIAVGTSLNEFTLNGYEPGFILGKKVVMVNIDEGEFGSERELVHTMACDAGEFLREFCREEPAYGDATFPKVLEQYLEKSSIVEVPRDRDVPGKVSPMEIIDELQRICPANTVFTADSGNNAIWVIHMLQMLSSQDFQMDINTGCMGAGVVSSIGSKFAAPDRPVVSVCGDGGFMMSGVEVTTAADYGIPVTWVVFNDNKLGMVEQGQRGQYGVTLAAGFDNCDIAAMGKSFGAESVVVESLDELRASLGSIEKFQRPRVIDVRFNDLYLPTNYGRVKATAADRSFQEFLST